MLTYVQNLDVARAVVESITGQPAPAKAPNLSYWEGMAVHPRAIVMEVEGEMYVAVVGEMPDEDEPNRRLGDGGTVYAIYHEGGNIDLTCNLWSLNRVPNAARHLFTVNRKGLRRLGGFGLRGLRAAQEQIDKAQAKRQAVAA